MAAARVCWLSVVVTFACCALPLAVVLFALQGAGCTSLSAAGSMVLEVPIGK